jgi:hypothetical protein
MPPNMNMAIIAAFTVIASMVFQAITSSVAVGLS